MKSDKFVFISFASPQALIADKISKALQEASLEVFYSNEHLSAGEIALNVVSGRLSDNRCIFMPIYSEDYFDPSRVSILEFTAFINKYRANLLGRICPIRLDGFEVPDFYKTINYIDLKTDKFDQTIPEIIAELNKLSKIGVATAPPRDVIVENNLSNLVRAEWDKIIKHLSAKDVSIKSTSQMYMFGWLACCEQNKSKPNPEISAFVINSMIDQLYNDVVHNRASDFIADFCTIRYLLLCHLAASGAITYPSNIIDTIADGLQNRDEKSHLHLRQAKASAEKLIHSKAGVVLGEVVSDIVKSLCSAAQIMGVSLHDIYKEELSPERTSIGKYKFSKISNANIATHEITMFMDDRQGIYYSVMDAIRKEVPFNVIQSISETLVPERLASVRLKVTWHERYLRQKIWDAIRNRRELKDHVFDISVTEYIS